MVINQQTRVRIPSAGVRAFLRKLTAALRLEGQRFNVCFVDDSKIQRLNAEFRGEPGPTDVLSFPWTPGEALLQTDKPGPLTRRFAPPSPEGRGLCSTSSCRPPPGGPGGEGGRRPGAGSRRHGSKSRVPSIRPSSGLGKDGCWADEFAGFLGDIVISAETARRNAALAGHFTLDEIRWLILHGLLHLLGYDHETDQGEMTRLELSLRGCLGIDGLGGKSKGKDKSRSKKQKAKTRASVYGKWSQRPDFASYFLLFDLPLLLDVKKCL